MVKPVPTFIKDPVQLLADLRIGSLLDTVGIYYRTKRSEAGGGQQPAVDRWSYLHLNMPLEEISRDIPPESYFSRFQILLLS